MHDLVLRRKQKYYDFVNGGPYYSGNNEIYVIQYHNIKISLSLVTVYC